MGGKVGPVRRRTLGRTGEARRFRRGYWQADAEGISPGEARRREEAERERLAEERAAAAERRRSG